MKARAHVIHHIPGRIRVKVPHSKGNEEFLQAIKESLSPLAGVKRVDANPLTGSIVVHYDPAVHEHFHIKLREHAGNADLFALDPPQLTEIDELAAKLEREAEFLATHSQTAFVLVRFVKQLNRAVREATGNTVDLKVLLPLALAVWAYSKRGANMGTPLWVTLAIFSFNSFVALHRPVPHVVSREIISAGRQQAPRLMPRRATKGA